MDVEKTREQVNFGNGECEINISDPLDKSLVTFQHSLSEWEALGKSLYIFFLKHFIFISYCRQHF